MTERFPIDDVRDHFPGLRREVAGFPAVFLDGPAGSQTPRAVAEAQAHYLIHANANMGGCFATSLETDAAMQRAHAAFADFLNAPSPNEVVFGPNMTCLTYALSGALARTWGEGDEVVVTRLDHEANVTPWVQAAEDAGAVVRHIGIDPADATLDLRDLEAVLGERTRLVAVTAASNLLGTMPPIARIAEMVHRVGALLFVDAVHYAPHAAVDVQAWGCDFLCCSAYKFFGPHVGVLWGRGELLASLPARKLRSAPDDAPGRWMVGTQNHEGIVGAAAAVDYLADLGRAMAGSDLPRRQALLAAFDEIVAHEQRLVQELLAGVSRLPGFRAWGITDPDRVAERTPTVAITHERLRPRELVERLAAVGIFGWSGNNYALPLTEALGLEPHGVVRLGLLHYNTAEEVARVLSVLAGIAA